MAVDRTAIENFIYREARFMDQHRYDEWEALWADDAIYWVPCDGDDTDPLHHISIIYADRAGIAARIARLKTGTAWSQEPKSNLRRVVSNIETIEDETGEITVHSNFFIYEVRKRSVDVWHNIWAGSSTHRLRPEGDDFKVAYKKVLLVNDGVEMPGLWFLV
jgi:3-phenylpropionate/cinnamic acid dioxygenase small subunit